MIRKTLSAVRLREKLAKRLDALERAADVGAISRGGAGDLVAEDVVERMPAPQDAADRELLWRAEFLRARLYRASARKSALDAATALLRAAEHEATLPPAPARSALVAPFARDLLERLRPLGSKRRAFRVFAVLADAVAVAPEAGPRGAELIDLAPAYLEGAVRRFSSAEIGRLLDKLQAALRRDAAPDAHARDRLQARLFRFALDAGDARRALDAWPGAAFVTPDDAERLARVAACAARFDDDVLAAIENGLRLGDAVRRRLERPLRDRARPAPDATEAQLRELEALNRAVARRYAAESWPWRHLAAIAARRDRPADAIAAFARLSDGAGDFEDAPAEIAPLLLRAGFRRVAAELGHEPTAALARAELALDADARAAPDALLDDLERLFLDDRVPRVLRNRAGHLRARLALAAGRADEAVDRLQRALSCDPSDGDLAGDLAEALLARGQAGRALAFVDVALERGETPRLLELKAGALEASGDVDGAAHALKRA
ncbi:MAG TPA: tetratricopeptide repeat protein, partial [Planctomycetota bacterium]|nr:tetratricopeptide repeat protein [Planctomycetota bacterium]